LEINFKGRYWKENDIWIARIDGLDLEAQAASPYKVLVSLMKIFRPEITCEGYDCSISVFDWGVFYFVLSKNKLNAIKEAFHNSYENPTQCLYSLYRGLRR